MSISARRFTGLIAFAVVLLVTQGLSAQTPSIGFPGAMGGGPATPVGYGDSPQGGWHGPASYGSPMMHGDPYSSGQSAPFDRDALEGNGWIENSLEYIFGQSKFRLDYFNWSLHNPGNVSLGAPVLGIRNENAPFEVFDRTTGATRGQGVVPTLGSMSLRDVNGMRGTFEIPFKTFSLEYNAWFTQKTGDYFEYGTSGINGNLPVTSLLANGVPSADNTVIYDQGYSAKLTSQLWGTEGNILFKDDLSDHFVDGIKLNLQPLVGFRYLQLKERLQQFGSDSNAGTVPVLTSEIDSENTNNIYGPTLGLRAEVKGHHLTFGVQPKITFGLNEYAANVSTENILAANELRRMSREDHVRFAPLFEFNAYLKWHLNENLAVHLGYDYMWMDQVVRPWNTINYDSTRIGGIDAPNITVKDHLRDFYLQGLTIGGEFRL